MKKTIIIGIGNSGRQDDGLGWAFIEEIEVQFAAFFDFEYRYQLQIEDAELISHYEQVFFVDADFTKHKLGYKLELLNSISTHSYTSHELSPATILALTQNIYQKSPVCFTLGISGKLFELKIGLTEVGKTNLKKAVQFFESEFVNTLLTL